MAKKIEPVITFRLVPFKQFIDEFRAHYQKHRKLENRSESELAVCINKNNLTVRNCFNNPQNVKDKTVTLLARCINFPCKIEWFAGEKYFYIGYVKNPEPEQSSKTYIPNRKG